MSDQHPPTRPPEPGPAYDDTQRIEQERPPATKPRFRDRVWGLRALVVVALACVILGGLAGAGIAQIGDHDDRRGRFGPGMGRFGGPGMPPPGQLRKWRQQQRQQWQQGQNGPWNGPGNQQQPSPSAPSKPPSPSATG